ncbi:MAG: hypothetical protein M3297_03395 [Thermoproteota archaeon]|nr:hypothetical protein [Thermoproteota archaeon]
MTSGRQLIPKTIPAKRQSNSQVWTTLADMKTCRGSDVRRDAAAKRSKASTLTRIVQASAAPVVPHRLINHQTRRHCSGS